MQDVWKYFQDFWQFISAPKFVVGAFSGAATTYFTKWVSFHFSKKTSRLESRRTIIKDWRDQFSLLAFKNHNYKNGRRGSEVILQPNLISFEAEHECSHYIHYVKHHSLYPQLEAASSSYFKKTLHERLKNGDKTIIRGMIDAEKLVFMEIYRVARKWGIE